jgi:hypothetical protein
MSRFASVKKATAAGRGNYCPNFSMTYLVEIDEAKFITTRGGDNAFILDFTIQKILVGETHEEGKLRADQEGRTVPTAGEQRNWYCNLSNDAGPADLRKLAETLWTMLEMGEGLTNDEEVEEICEHIIGADQPLKGVVFKLVTYNRPTRAKTPFTIHEWHPPHGLAADDNTE